MTEKRVSIRFAAFVITYNRVQVLPDTIKKILSQSLPPEELLIVDNSDNDTTEKLVESLSNPKISYYKVGYNSGPAGASKIGLEQLAKEGFEWIYWGDDNNPPRDDSVFKRMLECINRLEKESRKPGLMAGTGASFNSLTGRIRSHSNAELRGKEILETDVVPGGHTLFVNSELVRRKILPDPNLFFAFEDLDLSLKSKNAGFHNFVDARTWLQVRYKYGDSAEDYRPNLKKKEVNRNREFYSARNLLHIFYQQRYYSAFAFTFLKILIKIPLGYFKKSGSKSSKIYTRALKQFLTGKYQNNLKVD
ncbi:glycosyl transferase [Christiangramia fulva]|uniref:Glycosyl transferase n=1 Tax=Christiangramia fulva TaxID=2126553 RepID=A0A2R3Z9N5_9FLAO|nr:glycosyltransferase [Christiangramia fulva]AVR46892.1 glycosyl transferase [Christiangramia fulva]